jgi:hypothetical protein
MVASAETNIVCPRIPLKRDPLIAKKTCRSARNGPVLVKTFAADFLRDTDQTMEEPGKLENEMGLITLKNAHWSTFMVFLSCPLFPSLNPQL